MVDLNGKLAGGNGDDRMSQVRPADDAALIGGLLYWRNDEGDAPPKATNSRGMLDAFLSVSKPEDIPPFVLRFGPLTICEEHGLPVGHSDSCDMYGREQVAHWLNYRSAAEALVTLASGILTSDLKKRPSTIGVGVGQLIVEDGINTWLEWAQVSPRLRWRGKSAHIVLESHRSHSGLGVLAVQLLEATTTTGTLATCDGCKRVYPVERQPHSGRLHYCQDCKLTRKEGSPTGSVAERDKKRRYRERQRAKEQMSSGVTS